MRNRGPFPNDEAVFKALYLAIGHAKTKWHAATNWNKALAQLAIFFEGRLPV